MCLVAGGHSRAAASSTRALGWLALATLCAACGESSTRDEASDLLAQLRRDAPASRYEAVVRLGLLPPSQARREALAHAVRDTDARVRLMAGIVVAGDGPTEHASWLATPPARSPSTGPNEARPPNPAPTAHLSQIDQLVYLDPWFAGTLKPGALTASQSGDERVRTLGERAMRYMKPGARDR